MNEKEYVCPKGNPVNTYTPRSVRIDMRRQGPEAEGGLTGCNYLGSGFPLVFARLMHKPSHMEIEVLDLGAPQDHRMFYFFRMALTYSGSGAEARAPRALKRHCRVVGPI